MHLDLKFLISKTSSSRVDKYVKDVNCDKIKGYSVTIRRGNAEKGENEYVVKAIPDVTETKVNHDD